MLARFANVTDLRTEEYRNLAAAIVDLGNNSAATEREILELLCHGTSYGEVADMLHIGRGTVHTHVKNIYRKLDVSSKAEATKVAIQRRLFIP